MITPVKNLLILFSGFLKEELSPAQVTGFLIRVANHPEITYSLMTKSPDFLNFVMSKSNQSSLTLALNENSKKSLLTTNSFEDDIVSIDTKEVFSPFKGYISLYLMDQISSDVLNHQYTSEEYGKINLACELGSYDALSIRCQINCNKIKKNINTDVSPENFINDIIQDLARLVSLYGFMGYIKAAKIHSILNEIYVDAHEPELALLRKDQTIKSFLCAEQILTNPKMSEESIKIMNKLCRGKSLVLTMDGKEHGTWEELKKCLFGLISADDKVRIEKMAADEITALLHKTVTISETSVLN